MDDKEYREHAVTHAHLVAESAIRQALQSLEAATDPMALAMVDTDFLRSFNRLAQRIASGLGAELRRRDRGERFTTSPPG